MQLCQCPRDALCERCVETLTGQLGGVAEARGIWWAERVARKVPCNRQWPPYEGRAAARARELVGNLTRDPRLLEALAVKCAKGAARRWGQLRAG